MIKFYKQEIKFFLCNLNKMTIKRGNGKFVLATYSNKICGGDKDDYELIATDELIKQLKIFKKISHFNNIVVNCCFKNVIMRIQ